MQCAPILYYYDKLSQRFSVHTYRVCLFSINIASFLKALVFTQSHLYL